MTYDALRHGRHSAPGLAYHVTLVTAGRCPVFSDLHIARLTVGHMRALHESGMVESLAWVLMPDHLHWLFILGAGADLPEAMRRFKGASARAINLARGGTGPVWQRAYYDHAVRREEDLAALARYIVANPLRRGLAERIGDYPHWDAAWV